MNRLQSELSRLYLLPHAERTGSAEGGVRAMILELASPADWTELSKVWRGVQTDLGLPAPAIAVSGGDGMQLWFSLEVPVRLDRAAAFLARMAAQYLSGIAADRLRLMPAATGESFSVPLIPRQLPASGNWSAFVAPDLAAVFVETPWLDVEPSIEGQGELLGRLACIKAADFDAVLRRLSPPAERRPTEAVHPASDIDPKRFLQQVLNDESIDLALRIQAASALVRSSS